jgi:CMP-N-acetylneuraminic acid synthetase
MTVLFLIVARGGSKRVPGKNLRWINGLSLVGYKAKAAKQSQHCLWSVISTDSAEMAAEAEKYGVGMGIKRPPELATDTATTEDVVRHAMAVREASGGVTDAIMLLEPSSPFVRPSDYEAAIALMEATHAELVCGQVVYLFTWNYLKTRVDLYDRMDKAVYYSMPTEYAVDIDTPFDLIRAEWMAATGVVDLSWTQS